MGAFLALATDGLRFDGAAARFGAGGGVFRATFLGDGFLAAGRAVFAAFFAAALVPGFTLGRAARLVPTFVVRVVPIFIFPVVLAAFAVPLALRLAMIESFRQP